VGSRFASLSRVAGALAICTALVSASVTTSAATTHSAKQPAYDPKGVLRYATDLTGAGLPVYDPVKMTVSDSGTVLGQLLYDTLLRAQPDGSLQPELAKSATIDDPQTITVTLKPGLEFQDGTPLDAKAVAFTILRNRDASSVAFPSQIKDVASVDVVNPATLTIRLTKAESGAFYPLLGGLATMPVSPTAVQKGDPNPITNPMGAGPFKVSDYVPEQHLTLTKSPTYWNAKNIKLGGVQYVQAPTGPQAINNLRAGSVDVIGSDISQLDSLSGGGIKTAVASSATSLLWFQLCKTQKPLDDPRVRQALNYGLDRNAVNVGLAGGKGEPAWSLVPGSSALYASDLDNYYAYNPKKAKKLLKEAGYGDGLQLTLIPSPGISGQLAEIAQQSWKKAGIDVSIVPSTNIVQDFFVDHKTNMAAASVVRSGLDAIQSIYTPGHLGDVCDYQDPTLTAKINQLASMSVTDPQYKQVWQEAQDFVIKNALSVYGLWLPAVIAYSSDRVDGIKVVFPGVTAYPDFFSAYVKK
jgi:peptide/nickel transport system substrate-binding protein